MLDHPTSSRLPDGALYATAEQLANRYQVRRQWIYDHLDALGGVRLSDARGARVRFHVPTADDYMESRRARARRPMMRPRGGRSTRDAADESNTPAGAPVISFR
jgi:hypothetical protein